MKAIIEKYYKWLLVIVILLAAVIRLWNFGNGSFFGDFDEYYTAKTVIGFYENKVPNQPVVNLSDIQSSSFSDALADANRDFGNSFIYNLTLHYFGKLFGNSDEVFRLFSVVFDLISILLIASVGRLLKISKERILLACIIYALFPYLIGFSNIVRTYSFTTAVTLLLIRTIIVADKSEKPIIPILSIAFLATTLFLGHYLTYYVLIVTAIFFLLHRKTFSVHFKRVWSGFMIAAIACAAFLVYNYQGLSDIGKRSKKYEEIADSGQENSRRLEAITPAVFSEKTARYLNTYYIGSTTGEVLTKAYINEKAAIAVNFVLLLVPLILLFNVRPDADNKKWLILFVSLFVAGNLSAIGLSLISGHMTSLGVKYSMFSIPFYLMTICFFVRFNFMTRAALAFMILVSSYTIYNRLGRKGMKTINIEMAGLPADKEYYCKDYPLVKTALVKILDQHKGDTLFVNHVNDLVFIKCAMIDLGYSSAYILENDSTAKFRDRVIPLSFKIPG